MTTVTEPSPPLEDDQPSSSAERRRRRIRIGLIAAAVVTPLVAWLAFGYFGVQYLFIDDEVDEANPFATAVESDADPGSPVAPPAPGPSADNAIAPAPSVGTEATPAPTTPTVSTAAQGRFESGAHPTEGEATVITDGSTTFLRFEDFATDNGPDLNVYLVADGDVDRGFVDLGNLKGNVGNQNYELDPDLDLERYDTVVIWCVRFSVSFGQAALTLT